MTRDLPPDPEEDQEPDPAGAGRVVPTSPRVLAGFAVTGLVLGGLVRPVALWREAAAPRVGWVPVLSLFLAAAVLGWVAWSTYDVVQRRRRRLAPHQAVNRLVLAKACALTGALVAGGYLGYAVSWVGRRAALAGERVGHSLLAAAAAALVLGAALVLERACRVPRASDSED